MTYDSNGAGSGIAPVDGTTYEDGQYVTVLGNPGALARNGYTFTGWNSQADGSGSGYVAGNQFVMGSVDVTLYAQWSANPTYTLTYDGNGSTEGTVPVDSVGYEEGLTVTVLGNSGALVNPGYSFTGWNTAADGSGSSYAQGTQFTIGASDITLYAQWSLNSTWALVYVGNGNTGGDVPLDSNNYEQGWSVTVLGNSGNLARDGYSFSGWNTKADGSGSGYRNKKLYVRFVKITPIQFIKYFKHTYGFVVRNQRYTDERSGNESGKFINIFRKIVISANIVNYHRFCGI